MAKKIQAWVAYGPRLEPASPMESEELIENIIQATNQSRGSVLAVLAELDVQLESGLKAGRVVKMPNGTHFQPIGKKDGKINLKVRVNPELTKKINMQFRGKWRNAEHIGLTEAEILAIWNDARPARVTLTPCPKWRDPCSSAYPRKSSGMNIGWRCSPLVSRN